MVINPLLFCILYIKKQLNLLSNRDSILLQEEVFLLKKRFKQQDEIILQNQAIIAEKDFIIERTQADGFWSKERALRKHRQQSTQSVL